MKATIKMSMALFILWSNTVIAQLPKPKVSIQPVTGLKYDVDIELDYMKVNNVRDLDGTEDLYGTIKFFRLTAKTKVVDDQYMFFEKTEGLANSNNFREGTYQVDKRRTLITNLTLDELRNIEIKIYGILSDDEGVMGSRVFRCMECAVSTTIPAIMTKKFIEMPGIQTSISNLKNDGNYQYLVGVVTGNANSFDMNFYENGIINDGNVRFFFRVWVKPHN